VPAAIGGDFTPSFYCLIGASKLRTTMLRNLITWILFAFIGAHRDESD
jgi:hypothetical protein